MGEDYFGIRLLNSSSSYISDFVRDRKDRKSKKPTGFKAEYVKEENTPTLPLLPYATINYLQEKTPVNYRQNFIFKGLSARIESSLKERLLPVLEVENPQLSGIKLLSTSSDRITAFEEVPTTTVRKHKVKKEKWREQVEPKVAIAEAAVDPEWITSGEVCQGWKDTKRPRVTALRLVKTNPDGSLTCDDSDT